MKKIILVITAILLIAFECVNAQSQSKAAYNDQHRPQIHFTPKANFMNDPNGMVFYKGVYHLFFQYNPDSTVWGPNHWGHATSKIWFIGLKELRPSPRILWDLLLLVALYLI